MILESSHSPVAVIGGSPAEPLDGGNQIQPEIYNSIVESNLTTTTVLDDKVDTNTVVQGRREQFKDYNRGG